ncbi:MAG: diguanylate cyclase [Myxococcota bacterium]|nr:diguanylate cyclase [Myxococcota bacterium]
MTASKLRVLVADDDPVTRRILQLSLQRLNHDCVLAKDGNEAWQIFGSDDVDVVISDWTMPGIDGLELCKRVREGGKSAYTYFILLTANDEKQHFLVGMQAGADDYLRKPPDPDELQVRMISATRITALHRQLSQQNAELERLNRALFDQGRTDPLTGVGNRLRMQEDLAQLWNRAKRAAAHGFCVALVDIDYFKRYNDSCGHQAGDVVLRTVAHTLVTKARAGDAVYRYGGEEFLVMLPALSCGAAVIAMQRLHAAIGELKIPHAGINDPYLTISCGIARFTDEKSLDQLVREADVALYVAKSRGRNRVVSYDDIEPLEAQALAFAKR